MNKKKKKILFILCLSIGLIATSTVVFADTENGITQNQISEFDNLTNSQDKNFVEIIKNDESNEDDNVLSDHHDLEVPNNSNNVENNDFKNLDKNTIQEDNLLNEEDVDLENNEFSEELLQKN